MNERSATPHDLSPVSGWGYVPLAPRAPVSMRRSACLHSRLHASACAACEEACPARCLRIEDGAVSLSGGCTGCGRCRAACPMGALAVGGFEIDAERLGDSRTPTLRVACARADRDAAGRVDLRVPCLGGLAEADLLWLCAHLGDATLWLVDAGRCGDCESGRGTGHPAAEAHARTSELMRQAGVPAERLPRLQQSRGSTSGPQDPLQSRGRSRRGFFGALARPAAATAPAATLAGKAPSPARGRLLEALRVIAQRYGGKVAASVFHALQVLPACTGHRVCATVCPTGALVRYRDEPAGRMGIAFDAEHCIGCGECAAACSAGALHLVRGAGRSAAGLQRLTAAPLRECADCGARFAAVPAVAETRCHRCRRSVELARAAFTTLFSGRTPLQGME